jgi:hypothetical protein
MVVAAVVLGYNFSAFGGLLHTISWVFLAVLCVFFFLGLALRSASSRFFQGTMVCVQIAFFALPLAIAFNFHMTEDPSHFVFFTMVVQVTTILIMLLSSSFFKLKWSISMFSCLGMGMVFLAYFYTMVEFQWDSIENTVCKFIFEPIIVLGVAAFVPRILREAERARRTEWMTGRLKDEAIKVQSTKIRIVQSEKAVLQDKLRSAQKLVKQVMKEGGKLLDTYHLDYSEIDFGGEDEEERTKLGEGAHVICTPPSSQQETTDTYFSSQVRYRVQGHVSRRAPCGSQDHARREDHGARACKVQGRADNHGAAPPPKPCAALRRCVERGRRQALHRARVLRQRLAQDVPQK